MTTRVPSDQTISASLEAQEDRFYALPSYVEVWCKGAEKLIPEGWRLVPWTLNRSMVLKNSRGEVHHVFTYEYIEDGGVFYLVDNDQL